MNKNTVFRVQAPNTTKAEKRRRKAITEREREERRPRLERANPKAVPLTREAYREITDPSKGQGNVERFLPEGALTALTAAAGVTSAPAAIALIVPAALKFRSDLKNFGVETALTDPSNLMLLAGMIRGPGAVRQTRWYHDLVNRYGTRDAEAAAKFISTDAFKNFFWQGDPASVVRESSVYSTVRSIIKKIGGSPDEGKALIGGSASINKFGTIHRPSAVAHDLDTESYIGGASKRPWEPIPGPDYVTDAWYDKFVRPLERPGAVEASPILQRIREQFPKTHANAPILEWDDAMWKDNVANRYKEGVFQKINNFPDVYPQVGGHQFIGTRINGVPVDIFLSDAKINQVPGSVYAPPETAFEFKRMYAEENALKGRPPRPKDVADFESYRPFSRENPVVDPETGRAQFSPSNFGDQILTEENLPAVSNVETYPGSGEAVPMIMNTRGQMVYPFSDAALRQDAKGGDAGGEVTENAKIVNSGEAADTPVTDGPRIVINPSTFRNEKDALCVAYNEAYRIIMELNGFDPTSEPTEEQRRFFADTAYADDEQMLRRTILARICTFDTSVKHPTSEQLEEAVEFLETVMEIGAPQNEEEQSIVQRTKDVLTRALEVSPEQRVEVADAEEQPAEEQPAAQADIEGGAAGGIDATSEDMKEWDNILEPSPDLPGFLTQEDIDNG